jgi:RNA polymerase sigma-70 factor (ECF subfamily)
VSEREIETLHRAGDLDAAATLALERYGGEILGYLAATLRSEQEAEEVFSDFCEDLWRGLGAFAWGSSMRTWLYVLARHAAARHLRSPRRHRAGREGTSQLEGVAARVRSATADHLRSAVKDAFATIRRSLDHDDQTLLVLRVDRRMAWNEIAAVMEGSDADGDAIRRAAARLRKRFQLLKEELRARAREAGLDLGDE